ncbi:MAG: VRR-NUC domain-containing protein [Fibrella sp.]|nr:VRR-NUC domain-containing protein [Armatimonadota bacterium]
MRPPPEPDPLESWHQELLIRQCTQSKSHLPELAELYAIPNGGFRYKATAAAMQRQGVKAGIPDLALDIPRRGYHGLKIEMKRYRTGRVEEEQSKRLARNAKDGYRAIVCWGWLAAWEEVLWYLGREDLLIPSHHVTTNIVAAYPASPFWQRRRGQTQARLSG